MKWSPVRVHLHQTSVSTLWQLVILFSLKTKESLEKGLQPHLFSMRTESLASSQSCRTIKADAWCKWALRKTHVSVSVARSVHVNSTRVIEIGMVLEKKCFCLISVPNLIIFSGDKNKRISEKRAIQKIILFWNTLWNLISGSCFFLTELTFIVKEVIVWNFTFVLLIIKQFSVLNQLQVPTTWTNYKSNTKENLVILECTKKRYGPELLAEDVYKRNLLWFFSSLINYFFLQFRNVLFGGLKTDGSRRVISGKSFISLSDRCRFSRFHEVFPQKLWKLFNVAVLKWIMFSRSRIGWY